MRDFLETKPSRLKRLIYSTKCCMASFGQHTIMNRKFKVSLGHPAGIALISDAFGNSPMMVFCEDLFLKCSQNFLSKASLNRTDNHCKIIY